jgi:hypothetical protein
MTASNGGDPAMDPGDAGPEATGPDILDPVTVRLARSGPDCGADRAGSRARIAAVGDRLMSPMPADRLWGWVGPLAVTAFAAILRFSRLSVPHAVNYDETDYIKDAWSILQHGVEWIPVANPAGYPPGQSYVNNLLLSGARTSLRPALATAVASP